MASLGIARLTISKVLDHVETGVTAVYDRHGYDAEKRHALEAWASHLEGILSDEPKTGSAIVARSPGWLSLNVIDPPWASAMARTRLRPSPAPGLER